MTKGPAFLTTVGPPAVAGQPPSPKLSWQESCAHPPALWKSSPLWQKARAESGAEKSGFRLNIREQGSPPPAGHSGKQEMQEEPWALAPRAS